MRAKFNSSDPFATPRVFTPLHLLPRSQLPLAYLDTLNGGSQLFSAHIHILESVHAAEQEPYLLIAEEGQAKRFYAIERAKRRTYALCRLGTWVSRQQLERSAETALYHCAPPMKRHALPSGLQGQPWWKAASVNIPDGMTCVVGGSIPNETPSLSMKLVPTSSEVDLTGKPLGMPATTEDPQPPSGEPGFGRFNTQDMLQELAKHYMDTLYLSRTSLAYFTKGPLSRARAAFAGQSSSQSRPTELINFLRDSILTASLMDRKYKDGIAGVIKELVPHGLGTPGQASKSKKKRKWRSKRDKFGFFVDERERLETWWTTQNDTSAISNSGDTIDAALKRRLTRLRSRETYMQIILALEVLALETTYPARMENETVKQADANDSQAKQSVDINLQAHRSEVAITVEKQKARKSADLPALLEMLVDRLCIWHSLDSHASAKIGANSETRTEAGNDDLRDFCVEVIIPFYMSRMPHYASTVNKKLGGPSPPSPLKGRPTASRKPGAPAPRPVPDNRLRKPLSRVSSETLNEDPKPVPKLHRSATDTRASLPRIKREDSETPTVLNLIPPDKVSQARKPRPNVLQSIPGLGRREVDLCATSRTNETKMRNKAEMDHKLKEAISALKKPNRVLAFKEVAESTDASFAKSLVRNKPGGAQKKRAERPQGIRVAATPTHDRMVKFTLGPCVEIRRRENEANFPGDSHVPSPSARLASQHHFLEPPSSSFAVPQTGHRLRHDNAAGGIEDTPSRSIAKLLPPGLPYSSGKPDVIIDTRHTAAIEQSPSRPIRSLSLTPVATSTPPPNAAFPDPLLTKCEKDDMTHEPVKERPKSIYDALGWNDDYEQLT